MLLTIILDKNLIKNALNSCFNYKISVIIIPSFDRLKKNTHGSNFMNTISGEIITSDVPYSEFNKHDGKLVSVSGYVHRIREMTGFSFVILRTARDLIQCVYAPEFSDYRWDEKLCEEACVKVTGKVVGSKDRDGNDRFELQIHDIKILSLPADALPIVLFSKGIDNVTFLA